MLVTSEEWRTRSCNLFAVHASVCVGVLFSKLLHISAAMLSRGLGLGGECHLAWTVFVVVLTSLYGALSWRGQPVMHGMIALVSGCLRWCTLGGCAQSLATALICTTASEAYRALSCAVAVSRLRPGHIVELSGMQWCVLAVSPFGLLLVEASGDGMVLGGSDGLQLMFCTMGRWLPRSFNTVGCVIAACKMLSARPDIPSSMHSTTADFIINAHHRARRIQWYWRRAISCPSYAVCVRRLRREASELASRNDD